MYLHTMSVYAHTYIRTHTDIDTDNRNDKRQIYTCTHKCTFTAQNMKHVGYPPCSNVSKMNKTVCVVKNQTSMTLLHSCTPE